MKNNEPIRVEADRQTWDQYYSENKIPWQSNGLSTPVKRFLKIYPQGVKVLEVGCGSARDSQDFLALNFNYSGIDISPKVIDLNKKQYPTLKDQFFAEDFLQWKSDKSYDVIYEKGVFHNLAGEYRRQVFIKRVAQNLKPGGIWISVCGSADDLQPGVPHGALFLQHLIEPAETYFEILEVIKSRYGTLQSRLDFQAWHCVFKRR